MKNKIKTKHKIKTQTPKRKPKAEPEVFEIWIMPMAVATLLDETLGLDSESTAFDLDLRLALQSALQQRRVISTLRSKAVTIDV